MSILAALILIWNLSSRKIYTFTAEQRYLRGEWFALTQYFGLAAVAIDGFYIIRCRKQASGSTMAVLAVYFVLIAVSLVIQIFFYGIALLNIAMLLALVVSFIVNQMEIARSLDFRNSGSRNLPAAYHGEYMSQFPWADTTNAALWWQANEHKSERTNSSI